MLAHVFEPRLLPDYRGSYVQPKLNGVRALYQNGHFQSRDEIPWKPAVLRHLSETLRALVPENVILDGELYKHGWPLQKINGAISVVRDEPNEDTVQVEYHIFDQVSYGKSFFSRFLPIMNLLSNLDQVKVVRTCPLIDADAANKYYSEFVSLGYEGMMYRVGDCPYTKPKQPSHASFSRRKFLSDKNNRTWHLLKRKAWLDDEFEIIGQEEGEGKRAEMTGAFVCVTATGQQFKVGTGFTETDAFFYWHNPGILRERKMKVQYLCLSTDGIPLNPSMIAIL